MLTRCSSWSVSTKADRPVKGFSGGERQRLGIAQAQVHYPDLLILDEPAASLDPHGRQDVLEVMGRLRKHTTIFYSTHILDDVQHVSDTVAILNNGELVASGPIETLLAGSGGPVFTSFLKGDTDRAQQNLIGEDWVQEIQTTRENGETTWIVRVTDDELAERHLLRVLLADEDLVVTDYGRKSYELEEIFMSIVEGGSPNGGK